MKSEDTSSLCYSPILVLVKHGIKWLWDKHRIPLIIDITTEEKNGIYRWKTFIKLHLKSAKHEITTMLPAIPGNFNVVHDISSV